MIDNPFLLYGYEGTEYFCDREEEDYKKQYHHLTQVQAILLRAVAIEGKVKQPTSGLFVKKYHLRSASSVQ